MKKKREGGEVITVIIFVEIVTINLMKSKRKGRERESGVGGGTVSAFFFAFPLFHFFVTNLFFITCFSIERDNGRERGERRVGTSLGEKRKKKEVEVFFESRQRKTVTTSKRRCLTSSSRIQQRLLQRLPFPLRALQPRFLLVAARQGGDF